MCARAVSSASTTTAHGSATVLAKITMQGRLWMTYADKAAMMLLHPRRWARDVQLLQALLLVQVGGLVMVSTQAAQYSILQHNSTQVLQSMS